MKTAALILAFLPLFCLAQTPDTIRQSWRRGDKIEPTRTEVLLQITVLDFAKKRLPDLDVRVLDTQNGKVYQGLTGRFGEIYFLMPKGREYRIDAGDETGVATFTATKENWARESLTVTHLSENFRETVRNDSVFQQVSLGQTPTRNHILVRTILNDLDDKPLSGEVLYFRAKATGKIYVVITNKAGKANAMLPKGDTYCFSTGVYPDLKCYEVPQSDMAGMLNITFNTISTAAFRRREAERARLAAVRDSLFELARIRDSIRQSFLVNLEEDFLNQMGMGVPPDSLKARIERRAARERDLVKKDPDYFKKSGEVLKATLYRMKDEWAQKVIVTDMTGSMSPYVDQLILWHALQLSQNEDHRYVFFNDGDAKSTEEKIIGSTGGIYYSDTRDINSLLGHMQQVSKNGSGGDGPENDLEALLKGKNQMTGTDELVLVADNYSDVRDIELLERLQVPVRIILCGTEHGVNEQYLEIAYRTGGSVHTIEQDIANLTTLSEGQVLAIGAYQYRISRGKFIQVTKM